MDEKNVEKSDLPMPKTVGFRPTDKVFKIIAEAEKVTGMDRAEFLSKCVEEAAQRVIEKELRGQYERAKTALDKLKTKGSK